MLFVKYSLKEIWSFFNDKRMYNGNPTKIMEKVSPKATAFMPRTFMNKTLITIFNTAVANWIING